MTNLDNIKAMNDSPDIPDLKRRRSLRFSVWDAGFYALMVGFGETYFIPLLLALGATNVEVGVFTAIPQLCIALSQFISIYLVERFKARKKIIVTIAALQSVTLAAILFLLLKDKLSPWFFIFLAAAYFGVNGIGIPAWSSLIGDLTAGSDRGHYFGRRTGLYQALTFLSMFAAGLALQHFAHRGVPLVGFSVIIAAAMFSRLGSAFTLFRHFDVPYIRPPDSGFTFLQFLRRSPHSNFAHFVFFVALMSFATQMSAPFFAAYMLRDLHFSYLQYTIAQGVFILTQFWAMRRWGDVTDKYGNRIALRITGAAMPFLPLLWLLSQNFHFIIFIQIICGLTWAGWTLAAANFLFDAVTPPKRARCAAYFNFFNSGGIFVGALIGAWLSAHAPSAIHPAGLTIHFFAPLQYIFVVSAALRVVIVLLFMPTVHEVREVPKPTPRRLFLMLININPFSSSGHEPYTGVGPDETESGDRRA